MAFIEVYLRHVQNIVVEEIEQTLMYLGRRFGLESGLASEYIVVLPYRAAVITTEHAACNTHSQLYKRVCSVTRHPSIVPVIRVT